MLFHYLLPKPYIDYAVYSKNKGSLRALCQRQGFPTYLPLYKDQNEISVKGALFPHFIFGVHYIENDEKYFVVNPYLFSMENELENFPYKGFPVDQTYFKDLIKTTNYNRYGVAYEDSTFEQTNL